MVVHGSWGGIVCPWRAPPHLRACAWVGAPCMLPSPTQVVHAYLCVCAHVYICVCGWVPSAAGFAENGFGKKPRPTQQHRFELLGYDFMVDEDLKVGCWGLRQRPLLMLLLPC